MYAQISCSVLINITIIVKTAKYGIMYERCLKFCKTVVFPESICETSICFKTRNKDITKVVYLALLWLGLLRMIKWRVQILE